jgi:hypothetical protein
MADPDAEDDPSPPPDPQTKPPECFNIVVERSIDDSRISELGIRSWPKSVRLSPFLLCFAL